MLSDLTVNPPHNGHKQVFKSEDKMLMSYKTTMFLSAAVAFRQMSSHPFPAVAPSPSPSHVSPAIALSSSQSQASSMLHSAVMPQPVVPEVPSTISEEPFAMCEYSV